MFDLTGKVAIVTGGNGGIGFGMARGLANAGAHVVVAALNQEKCRTAVQALRDLGFESLALPVDVADERSVDALVEQTIHHCGQLDILINNAGVNVRKHPQEIRLDEWQHVMDTNLTGTFLCSRAVYPQMKANGGGKIINIGSMMSIFGTSFSAAYGASKGGIVQLTKSLAAAWASDNIQVNVLLPGWIDTDLTRQAREQIPGLNEQVIARTPSGRWGRIDDVSGVAVFLASAASTFITGTAIPVDGGYSSLG
jgi:2-deoxy-D-gluconate 3-dehydrogenase